MFDPQTTGGLLLCAGEEQVEEPLAAIQADDPPAKIIGKIIKREKDVILFDI